MQRIRAPVTLRPGDAPNIQRLLRIGHLVILGDLIANNSLVTKRHQSIIGSELLQQFRQNRLVITGHHIRPTQNILRCIMLHTAGHGTHITHGAGLLPKTKAKVCQPRLLDIKPILRAFLTQHICVGKKQLQHPIRVSCPLFRQRDIDTKERPTAPRQTLTCR